MKGLTLSEGGRELAINLVKEADAIRKDLGAYRSGEDFVDKCRNLYNDVPAVKRVGLAFNRLDRLIDQLREALAQPETPVAESAPAQAPEEYRDFGTAPPVSATADDQGTYP
jgi:hypothetical protein